MEGPACRLQTIKRRASNYQVSYRCLCCPCLTIRQASRSYRHQAKEERMIHVQLVIHNGWRAILCPVMDRPGWPCQSPSQNSLAWVSQRAPPLLLEVGGRMSKSWWQLFCWSGRLFFWSYWLKWTNHQYLTFLIVSLFSQSIQTSTPISTNFIMNKWRLYHWQGIRNCLFNMISILTNRVF